MRHKTNVKFKTNFEKISSTNLSIIILKRTSSSFLNVEKKKKLENCFENKKNVVRISIIKLIKKITRTQKNFRSRKYLTSSNIIFVNVVVYNFFLKQKNVKLFIIFLKNIDDQF